MMIALVFLLAQAQAQPPPQAQPQAEPAQDPGQKPSPEFPHQSEELEYIRTETGFTLPRMTFEADATLTILSYEDYGGTEGLDLDFIGFSVEAAFGIVDGLQVEVELPFLWIDPSPGSQEQGIGDAVIEAKSSFRKGVSQIGFAPFDVAGGFRVTLPSGDEDEGLGREHASFGLFASASYPLLAWLAAHGEFWTEWQEDARPLHGVNTAVEMYPWSKELSLLAAINYSREGTEKSAVSLVPGAEFRFGDKRPMSIGAGVPLGITDRAADIGLIANFQLRF